MSTSFTEVSNLIGINGGEIEKAINAIRNGISQNPDQAESLLLALKEAISNDGDIEKALQDFLKLEEGMQDLGVKYGVIVPQGGVKIACGGLCIFLAGMVVGMLAAK
jgi:tetratricopeptide (TPR) repeat protein